MVELFSATAKARTLTPVSGNARVCTFTMTATTDQRVFHFGTAAADGSPRDGARLDTARALRRFPGSRIVGALVDFCSQQAPFAACRVG
jgi:hypothetical protein